MHFVKENKTFDANFWMLKLIRTKLRSLILNGLYIFFYIYNLITNIPQKLPFLRENNIINYVSNESFYTWQERNTGNKNERSVSNSLFNVSYIYMNYPVNNGFHVIFIFREVGQNDQISIYRCFLAVNCVNPSI